ncbi:MAG: hypothetical protein ACI81O_002337 [Cyclobacteriaceae bacterium]
MAITKARAICTQHKHQSETHKRQITMAQSNLK